VRLELARVGRKVYRTTADVFVAPFELLPSATLMEFFGSFGEEQQRRFLAGPSVGSRKRWRRATGDSG
jgi:hypothetical protein